MIIPISIERVKETGVLDLVWRVFDEFESPDYSDEGIKEFKDFIEQDAIEQVMLYGEFLLWGYYDGEKLVGMIASKPPCHIALLFVEKEYHRKGIARSLYNTVIDYYKSNGTCTETTVNSSPYAVEVYHRLGFVDTDIEQSVNGLRFTPMKHMLE